MKKIFIFALFLLSSVSLLASDTYDQGDPVMTIDRGQWNFTSYGTLVPATVDSTYFGGVRKLIGYPTTDYTLEVAESGKVLVLNNNWEETNVYLPQATSGTAGTYFTFTHGGYIENADLGASVLAKWNITPNSMDCIRYLQLATGDVLQSPASPASGDSVTLISSGEGEWWTMDITGTWVDGT